MNYESGATRSLYMKSTEKFSSCSGVYLLDDFDEQRKHSLPFFCYLFKRSDEPAVFCRRDILYMFEQGGTEIPGTAVRTHPAVNAATLFVQKLAGIRVTDIFSVRGRFFPDCKEVNNILMLVMRMFIDAADHLTVRAYGTGMSLNERIYALDATGDFGGRFPDRSKCGGMRSENIFCKKAKGIKVETFVIAYLINIKIAGHFIAPGDTGCAVIHALSLSRPRVRREPLLQEATKQAS